MSDHHAVEELIDEVHRLAAALAEVTRERDEAERERQKSVESEARCLTRALKAESRVAEVEALLGEAVEALEAIKKASDALHATKRAPGLQPFFVSDELDDAIEADAVLAEIGATK